MTPERDPEFGNQHPDHRFERYPSCFHMKLVETDLATGNRVDLGVQRRRDVQVRVIRPTGTRPWLPVIDQQFLMVVIEEPVLVHSSHHARSRAEPSLPDAFHNEDVGNVEQESTRPTNG